MGGVALFFLIGILSESDHFMKLPVRLDTPTVFLSGIAV